jgi:cell division protein FtsI/penicillin-binding protein 2
VLAAIHVLFVIFIVLLMVYLFFIQVVDVKNYRVRAKSQRVGRIFSMRGDIFDRNGIKLATDKVYSDVYAHPAEYKEPEELARALAPVLKMPRETLLAKLKKPGPVITLARNVDRATAQQIIKLHLRGISLGKKNQREYPQGSLAAHVLGYYNFDADIASGVEYAAKDKLEHMLNITKFNKTRDGKIIYDFTTDPAAITSTPKGENITLTIDAAIQHVCEKELAKMVKERSALRGTVIVMNPRNGEILAYAVSPTYDPNNYKSATPLQMKNWTLTDVFPPGSTFKIITLASAMELGKIDEQTKVLDTGKIKIGDWEIKNYDYDVRPYPGNISLVYLLEHSSNIGSVRVAEKMNSKEFYDMLKKFGFGSKSEIDLPGESSGLLPAYQHWDKSLHASMAYGYGTSISAMQMVSAVAALANDGVRVTPHVIKYSGDEAEKKIKKVEVVSPETAKTMTKLLTTAINNGKTAVKMSSYNVAAKTGTSLKPKENGKGYTGEMYTSTIGYLPASDPQIVIYVMIDSAKGGEVWGNTVAAPIFSEVATQSARILNLKPDKDVRGER